jgi:hypothetical protein
LVLQNHLERAFFRGVPERVVRFHDLIEGEAMRHELARLQLASADYLEQHRRLLTAQFYSPAAVLMVDLDDNRLRVAQRFGAMTVINSGDADYEARRYGVACRIAGRGVSSHARWPGP